MRSMPFEIRKASQIDALEHELISRRISAHENLQERQSNSKSDEHMSSTKWRANRSVIAFANRSYYFIRFDILIFFLIFIICHYA